jgi:hypothetical protein
LNGRRFYPWLDCAKLATVLKDVNTFLPDLILFFVQTLFMKSTHRFHHCPAIYAPVFVAIIAFAGMLTSSLTICACQQPAQQDAQTETKPATAKEPDESAEKWTDLFDGKSLDGWKKTSFGGEGDVTFSDGVIKMVTGVTLTGITCDRDDLPKIDYELEYEARRTDGLDFFAAVTFPYRDSHCSFVPGGWSGSVTGLSNIDDQDASENDTTTFRNYETGQWYKIRLRVTGNAIQAWIDDEQVVNQKIDKEIVSTRPEVIPSKPLGFCAWQSDAEIRKIRIRSVKQAKQAESKEQKVPDESSDDEDCVTTN